MAVSSSSTMHAGCSDQAYYLPVLAPAPSLIPSPISTTGWTRFTPRIDLSSAPRDGRPPPRPAGVSLQDLGPSPPGSCRLLPGSGTRRPRHSPSESIVAPAGLAASSGTANRWNNMIRSCDHDVGLSLQNSKAPSTTSGVRGITPGARLPGPRRSPASPPHDLPLRPSSRSLSR